jgi:hypothetical protein
MAAVKKDIGGTNLISGAENYLQHYNSIFCTTDHQGFPSSSVHGGVKKNVFLQNCKFFNHDARIDFVYLVAGRSKETNVNVVVKM